MARVHFLETSIRSTPHIIIQDLLQNQELWNLWQVSGRSDILDFEEVVKLDMQYINNWSIGLDLKILFKIIMVVLKKEGSK